MFVLIVRSRVKPEFVEAFKKASIENDRHSAQEPGVARFDLIQNTEDPTRFAFIEVFRSPDAHATHRETDHYLTWRDTVEDMMAEPRTVLKHMSVFPDDSGW